MTAVGVASSPLQLGWGSQRLAGDAEGVPAAQPVPAQAPWQREAASARLCCRDSGICNGYRERGGDTLLPTLPTATWPAEFTPPQHSIPAVNTAPGCTPWALLRLDLVPVCTEVLGGVICCFSGPHLSTSGAPRSALPGEVPLAQGLGTGRFVSRPSPRWRLAHSSAAVLGNGDTAHGGEGGGQLPQPPARLWVGHGCPSAPTGQTPGVGCWRQAVGQRGWPTLLGSLCRAPEQHRGFANPPVSQPGTPRCCPSPGGGRAGPAAAGSLLVFINQRVLLLSAPLPPCCAPGAAGAPPAYTHPRGWPRDSRGTPPQPPHAQGSPLTC